MDFITIDKLFDNINPPPFHPNEPQPNSEFWIGPPTAFALRDFQKDSVAAMFQIEEQDDRHLTIPSSILQNDNSLPHTIHLPRGFNVFVIPIVIF